MTDTFIPNCDKCEKPGANLRCSQCKCVYYCDRNCQKLHWKEHKQTCIAFTAQCKDQKTDVAKTEEAKRAIYSKGGELVDSECSICLECMESPVLLPCKHKFCFPCLNTHNRSMELEGACPLCRSELPGNLHQYVYNNAVMFLRRANNEPFGSDKRLLHTSMAQSELKKLSPDVLESNANIRFCLGDIHLCLGEFAEALEIYETVKTRIPERKVLLLLYIDISHAQIGLELYEAAKGSLREAMKHCEQTDAVQTRQIFYNFSRCAYETGMLTEAIDFGEQVIEMNRHYEGAYKYVALAHKAKGNLAEAARTMQRACTYETPRDSVNMERVKATAAQYAQERDAAAAAAGCGADADACADATSTSD